MAEIVLCCGKVCSGKSTFNRILEKEYGFYAFSASEIRVRRIDGILPDNLFAASELYE